MFLRRLLLIALVLASLAVVLSGCAADPYGWRAQPDHKPLPAVFVVVEREHLAGACGIYHPSLFGCARRTADTCYVFVTGDARPWERTHELAHCAGWSHK